MHDSVSEAEVHGSVLPVYVVACAWRLLLAHPILYCRATFRGMTTRHASVRRGVIKGSRQGACSGTLGTLVVQGTF
jgi:hypothetical protein